jgi:hypothetical protein
VVVGPVGTEAQNGAALLAALVSISTATASNPWLFKIEPGIYDLGSSSLSMKPYVDIEGSGELTTTIRGNGNAGTVVGAGPSEMRLLTVQNTGSSSDAYALKASSNCTNMYFDRVTFRASNGSSTTRAVSVGGSCTGAVFRHVTATATGGGSTLGISFESAGATPYLEDVQVIASGATGWNQGLYVPSTGTILDCSVRVDGGNAEGVILAGGTTYTNGLRVEIQASSIGIGLRADTTGGAGAASLVVENASVRVGGTATHRAALRLGGGSGLPAPSVSMRRTTLEGTIGVYGAYATTPPGSGQATIEASTIVGTTQTVQLDAGYTVRTANSQLSGGGVSGTVTCIGVYDENYASAGYTVCP